MSTKTVTIDTNEWIYPDSNGVQHTVTNAETFTFEMTDGGASAVKYAIDDGQSVATDDGYTIYFRPFIDDGNNTKLFIGMLADANDNTTTYNTPGEIVTSCPTTGRLQIWKLAQFKVDDVDAPTAISGRFEDQFGNYFTWTNVTVA